ncbi:unnamed protein product [Periconia digitata]|uniref:BHLH domain-containing protein n=1 Tax=Periconia digitata TaxID=1303443 RepID=A0A9W4URL4_9PLEO|nr:unnamed protein product [Periconia digitata]
MAVDWNAFLNGPWPDMTDPSSTDLSIEMPKTTSARPLGSTPVDDLAAFDSVLNANQPDAYFDDNLFGNSDYFLSDFEGLQSSASGIAGGDSTSESSPEPSNSIGLSRNGLSVSETLALLSGNPDQSPNMQSSRRPTIMRASTFPNLQYESMFPNNLESGFVEDLTFPDGPSGPSSTSKTTGDNNGNNPNGNNRNLSSTSTTGKRAHKAKPDILSACWTSPLCPNHDQDGPPPNPSNCGGGCAPFLFANDDTLPTPTTTNLLNEAQEVIPEDGVVEIKSYSKKRSESAISTNESSGRRFSTKTTPDSNDIKSESEDSPQAPLDDKPKPRRRLPHNQVERKYRESLNTQLESLRRVVPSLQQNRACDGADIEDLPAPSKPSKAVILASATAHIKQIEKDRKSLQDENQLLKTRVKALQALVKCDDCSLMQYVMDLKINQAK